jgi:hypothetical protein
MTMALHRTARRERDEMRILQLDNSTMYESVDPPRRPRHATLVRVSIKHLKGMELAWTMLLYARRMKRQRQVGMQLE